MENKNVKYSFQGMNRDISESKHPVEFFYEANNIRFLTTDEVITGGIAFEKGNELKITLPNVIITKASSRINTSIGQVIYYKSGSEIDKQLTSGELKSESGLQVIIGHGITRDSIILFSTDENHMDCMWEVNMETYDIKLLYLRNLNFSQKHLIQSVYNYENENIQKIYWVDGNNQIRFLNTQHSKAKGYSEELIDINSNTINFVGNFKVTQPMITDIVSGGNHTSGMVQYTYNLYRLNASQTKLAPFSELISLDKGTNLGGGKLNEIVGSSPVIEISDIDPEYTHIKVYAIKYTSYNQTPSISLIEDQEIPSSRNVNIFDDGSIKEEMSLEQLLFLGSDPIVPQHIESKDNYLFSANIKEKIFDVEIDTRVYSFPANSVKTKVYSNPRLKVTDVTTDFGATPPMIVDPNWVPTFENDPNYDPRDPYYFNREPRPTIENMIPDPNWVPPTITTTTQTVTGDAKEVFSADYTLAPKHDAVNLDFNLNRYQANSTVQGGEGKYLKFEVIQDDTITEPENYKFYKDNEIYRFGIQFYNRLGQTSLPKWMLDFKMPEGNLEGNYNTIKVSLKPEFYVWLNTASNFTTEDDKPIGYKVVRADRALKDRTIIAQGFLNGMMSNIPSNRGGRVEDASKIGQVQREEANKGVKIPSLQRVYGDHHLQLYPMQHRMPLSKSGENLERNEVITSTSSDGMIANTYQYNTIIQMFSPDVLFNSLSTYEGLTLRIKGANKSKSDYFWGQERFLTTKEVFQEGKVIGKLTPQGGSTGETNTVGKVDSFLDTGIFGPSRNEETMDFLQFYRDFTGGYIKSPNKVEEGIFGKPQFTETGQGAVNYNGKSEYMYYNTLEPMLTDNINDQNRGKEPGITSINSWGNRNLTMVLGTDMIDINDRKSLDSLFKRTGLTETNVMLVGELVKNDTQIYLGSIYGGNSFEDKKRTKYIEIGDYKTIDQTSVLIKSGGDTFVQKFRFAKVVKTNTEVYNTFSAQITEIVEGWVETDVDLKNRNDSSLQAWDSKFQPKNEEYHEYNRVYSQQPTIKQESELDYNFRRVKNYDTRIMASKVKLPGEYIDNWTDVLVNETQDLNGKYGRINALVSFKDNLFAFQDNAFAIIGVNPRVQVQGGDGLAIELGTGGVLHDYNYISTTSGSINKWGVISTNNGVYYIDALNKSILRFDGSKLEGLSASRGLHKYLVDNIDINIIKQDNPVMSAGVSLGYDLLNSDIYFTHNNGATKWTLCFNEKMGQFTGFYDYHAPIYIYTKEKLLTMNPNFRDELYETHAGEYNIFYGENKISNIIFIANPEVDHECLFNNIEYKSVALNNARQEQRYTWEMVRVHNEFQDSGLRALDPMVNIRKLNRKYRVALPRNQNSTDRIRNNWAFIELRSNNNQKLFFVSHDIVLHYRANYIMIG